MKLKRKSKVGEYITINRKKFICVEEFRADMVLWLRVIALKDYRIVGYDKKTNEPELAYAESRYLTEEEWSNYET